MKNRVIVLENIRSAYNVGTIIRTADALGYDVVVSGYTPSPETEEKVKKTSLGAESSVKVVSFRNPAEAVSFLKKESYVLIAAECTPESMSLNSAGTSLQQHKVAVIVGNEKIGILQETVVVCDHVLHIPMQGIKESLNVAEAAAIMMREMRISN